MKRTKVVQLGFSAIVLMFLAGIPSWLPAQNADLILQNGKILTVDNNFSVAEAVAISGNKILAVGANAEVTKLAGRSTQVIDLKGRTVTPGLVDTHRHMYAQAEGTYGGMFKAEDLHRYNIDWRGVRSKDDVLNQIKNYMDQYKFKPGQWIYFVNELQFFTRDG